MKKLAIVLAALAMVAGGAVTTALAGPYLSLNGGAVWVDDSDLSGGDFDGELSYDAGYVVNAAFGNAYANGVRAELELAYRQSDIDELSIDGWDSGSVDGDVSAVAGMVNAYYDFDTGSEFKPFIGAGLGYASVELDADDGGSEDDGVFAYQLMAGVGFAVSKQVSLDLQYRFFATEDPEFDDVESEYMTHNAMIGVRFNF